MAILGWRLGRKAVALAAAVTLISLASPATPARAAPLCQAGSNKWTIWTSYAANKYVRAELGYPGSYYAMLRAAYDSPGSGGAGSGTEWTFCSYWENGTKVTYILDTRNNRYVTAEVRYSGGNNGMLRARGTDVLAWEKFQFIRWGPNPSMYVIRSLANGKYVSAELNYTGNSKYMLRARATAIGNWEKFIIPCGFPYLCSW
jgi:hypothetical protein